jgi:hypothetical protein
VRLCRLLADQVADQIAFSEEKHHRALMVWVIKGVRNPFALSGPDPLSEGLA